MDNLKAKIKEMYNHNKLGILSLLFFSVLLNLELFLIDANFNGILAVVLLLTVSAYFINEIIIIKNYIGYKLNDFPDIEYNSYKTIILQTLKIYIKYAFLALIFFVIIYIIWCIVFVFSNSSLLVTLYKENYDDLLLKEYVSSIIYESKTLPLFLNIIFLLMFFKLLFVEHTLIFKQENYKIKNIVSKSKSIIQADEKFFIIAYFGDYLFTYLGQEILFKNNYVFPILWSIVDILLFMIFLIKFSDIKKIEYAKINENHQKIADEGAYINSNEIEKKGSFENESDTVANDKWICSKCGTVNEIYLPSCKNCGKEISNKET